MRRTLVWAVLTYALVEYIKLIFSRSVPPTYALSGPITVAPQPGNDNKVQELVIRQQGANAQYGYATNTISSDGKTIIGSLTKWLQQSITAAVSGIKFLGRVTFSCHTVTIAAFAFMVVSYIIFHVVHHNAPIYGDAIAKIINARSMWDNPEGKFNLADWGSVWLPGHTFLTALTVWITPLYTSGWSAIFWSALFYIIAVRSTYRIVEELTGNRIASFGSAALLFLNPNMGYFSVSAMTESCIIGSIALACLCIIIYEKHPTEGNMAKASIALALACVMRYETWFLFVGFFGIFVVRAVITNFVKSCRIHRINNPLVFRNTSGIVRDWLRGQWLTDIAILAFFPFSAIGGWFVWEQVIIGSALFFATGPYSARAIDVIGRSAVQVTHQDAVHNLHFTITNYVAAVRWNFQDPLLAFAIAGLAIYCLLLVIGKVRYLAPVYLMLIPVYFIVSLYTGNNAIKIVRGTLLSVNIRYGTIALPLVAIGIGLLIHYASRIRLQALGTLVGLVIMVGAVSLQAKDWRDLYHNTAVLMDASAQEDPGSTEIASWLHDHYDGGAILLEAFGTTKGVQYAAQIPLGQYRSELLPWVGKVLNSPDTYVEWILTHQNDNIALEMQNHPERYTNFTIVFENKFGRIYEVVDKVPKQEVKSDACKPGKYSANQC